jgi:hypothetical protein
MLSRFFGMALVASSAALPLSITTARCLADATYQDGTFNDADWSITSQGVGNGGSASGAQVYLRRKSRRLPARQPDR